MLDNNLNLADSADQLKDYKEPPPTDACDDVTDNVIDWIYKRDYKNDDFIQR